MFYKRLRHPNRSKWLQGHQSANQLARQWRACLHGKHFSLVLPPPHHVSRLCASLAIMKSLERGSTARHIFRHCSKSCRRRGSDVKLRPKIRFKRYKEEDWLISSYYTVRAGRNQKQRGWHRDRERERSRWRDGNDKIEMSMKKRDIAW